MDVLDDASFDRPNSVLLVILATAFVVGMLFPLAVAVASFDSIGIGLDERPAIEAAPEPAPPGAT